jgi:hypothetical protein
MDTGITRMCSLPRQNSPDLPRYLAVAALAVSSVKDAPETLFCCEHSEVAIVELHFSMNCSLQFVSSLERLRLCRYLLAL